MRRPQAGIVVGILVVLLVVTTGCSSLVGGKWAAKVNGESITIADYDTMVAEAQAAMEKKGADFSSENGQNNLAQLKSGILSGMVQSKLLAQEVEKQNINTEDAIVLDQLNKFKQEQEMSEEEFQEFLKWNGMNETDLKNILALRESVTKDLTAVSEEEAKAFFEENMNYYGKDEKVTASHILVENQDEAQGIIAQLNAGADFATLAKEKSTDTGSKESGGSLGEFSRGAMVAEFEEAAFSQPVGTVSTAPVKSNFGYHIIKVDAHVNIPDYEAMKERVKEDALYAAKDEVSQPYFTELYQKANIEYAKGYEPAS